MPSPCYTGVASDGYFLKHSFGGFFKDEYGACHILPYPGVSSAVNTLDGAQCAGLRVDHPEPDRRHARRHACSRVTRGSTRISRRSSPRAGSRTSTRRSSSPWTRTTRSRAPRGGQVPMVIISSLAAGRGAVATPRQPLRTAALHRGGLSSAAARRRRPFRQRGRALLVRLSRFDSIRSAPAAACGDQLPIGGASGCSGEPPPPMEAGPLLATTLRLARIRLMSCDQGVPLPAGAWKG